MTTKYIALLDDGREVDVTEEIIALRYKCESSVALLRRLLRQFEQWKDMLVTP